MITEYVDLIYDGSKLDLYDSKNLLHSSDIFQLKHWGFKSTDNYLTLYIKNDTIIKKVINYLEEENITLRYNEKLEQFLEDQNKKIDSFKSITSQALDFKNGDKNNNYDDFVEFTNQNIKRKLKDHQLISAYHLYIANNGANFSVPGSGKTSVVLTVFEKLRIEEKVRCIFVVGPPSSFIPWQNEFKETLGRDSDCLILPGLNKEERKLSYFKPIENYPHLILTTYHSLLNDSDDIIKFFKRIENKIYFVLDEAHYIKQIEGSWAKAAINVSKYALFRCVLTGTPLPKSFCDVFNLFDILWHDYNPITPADKINIQINEEKKQFDKAKDILKSKIDPFFIRIKKKNLNLTEPVFHPPFQIPMNKYENIIYQAIITRIREFSNQNFLKNIDLVDKLRRGRIIRLRQCVSYTGLLNNSIENYNEDIVTTDSVIYNYIKNYDELEVPAKLIFLKELISNIGIEKKVVVWTNFIGTIHKINEFLRSNKLESKYIYGAVPSETDPMSDIQSRGEIIKEFLDTKSGLNILIANPGACAESISLHKTCQNAIYYDLSYNCAQYLQSLDRIHRVGGSEDKISQYHFLQYENSLDQDIFDNLKDKSDKMSSIIDDDCNIIDLNMFDDNDDVSAYKRLFN